MFWVVQILESTLGDAITCTKIFVVSMNAYRKRLLGHVPGKYACGIRLFYACYMSSAFHRAQLDDRRSTVSADG
jgi:uncharacterized membrane protein